MDVPRYELKINDQVNDVAEVSFVALVDAPAIKRDFLAFKDEPVKIEFNEEQRIITGPLMVPEQLIYRQSEKFGEHYVFFSAPTIKQIAIKFSKKGFQKNVNIMHEADMQVDGLTMFESFISDPARGISPMNAFKDLPAGTWFGSFYVENPAVWDLVKAGKVKGFSVEGMFDYAKPATNDEQKLEALKKFISQIFN
ncbi:MAG TPA: XkdF-like putative serine protease domain-containing protein [Ferruginibacter sp.]|nr:XkdF-like putative serine protease domain-containing protein [Ferruginibacter sp.]HPH93175.1 XkdF-like putative serine protease domain-containing protein [Ferruginibacter sp.]